MSQKKMMGSSSKVVRVDWSFAVTAASSANDDHKNGGRESSDDDDDDDGKDNDTIETSRVNVRVIVGNEENDEEEEIEMEMPATALRALTRDLDVALATIRTDDEK
tara:strand:- start:100 stop:417 length:318 start_codon:yes stop_codon:yes gene_type:complete